MRIIKGGNGPYNPKSIDDTGALLTEKISARQKNKSALGSRDSLRSKWPHISAMKRGFASGALNEDTIESIDKTHFVIDFDNGRTLEFVGEKQIKYADVVSGGEGMTMVVRLSGGHDATILPPNDNLHNPREQPPDSQRS
uniref:Predicted protein putative n=1 Tax=Albugo laibachii Nc14 TaxID=890382 RepID=F0WTV9_9STRA|nr:predicted protein putative [Albugo laibachii Nc14]|eukprot:CCA24803.1 predicted protein putative [Albugo laibachii Nc14]